MGGAQTMPFTPAIDAGTLIQNVLDRIWASRLMVIYVPTSTDDTGISIMTITFRVWSARERLVKMH